MGGLWGSPRQPQLWFVNCHSPTLLCSQPVNSSTARRKQGEPAKEGSEGPCDCQESDFFRRLEGEVISINKCAAPTSQAMLAAPAACAIMHMERTNAWLLQLASYEMAGALRRVFQRVAKKVIREYERSERSCFPCGALLRSLSKQIDVRASCAKLTVSCMLCGYMNSATA